MDFTKNSFQVQLAAVRNKLAAQNEWKRLKMRHSEIQCNLVFPSTTLMLRTPAPPGTPFYRCCVVPSQKGFRFLKS